MRSGASGPPSPRMRGESTLVIPTPELPSEIRAWLSIDGTLVDYMGRGLISGGW